MPLDVHTCVACAACHLQSHPDFYVCGTCGLISARDRTTTQIYDSKYVADRYEKYDTTEKMSNLRLDLLQTIIFMQETLPRSWFGDILQGQLLDVGYGNGSFIRKATRHGWDCYGHDVNPTDYEGVRKVELPIIPRPPLFRYRVITFFDALEHFSDLSLVRRVAYNAEYILCSVPCPPANFPEVPESWKHYRPGEHHHYFTPQSIEKLFTLPQRKAELIYMGNPEDAIRGSLKDGSPNITTCAVRLRTVGA